jgi:hypothetical protein
MRNAMTPRRLKLAFVVALICALPLPMPLGLPASALFPLLAVWALVLAIPLYGWWAYTCPHCQQRAFFPVMRPPGFFVPRIFAKRCANCNAQIEA